MTGRSFLPYHLHPCPALLRSSFDIPEFWRLVAFLVCPLNVSLEQAKYLLEGLHHCPLFHLPLKAFGTVPTGRALLQPAHSLPSKHLSGLVSQLAVKQLFLEFFFLLGDEEGIAAVFPGDFWTLKHWDLRTRAGGVGFIEIIKNTRQKLLPFLVCFDPNIPQRPPSCCPWLAAMPKKF